MTKQRHCFVAQVGDAIEALASALDPERKPPFKGDILDLLEWAEKDVLEMRAEIERLKTVPMRYRRMAFNAQLQDENAQLSQQLAAAVAACKVKDEALRDCAFDESGYCINPDAEEALAVMQSISEWKTRWQKENDELRQQLATRLGGGEA